MHLENTIFPTTAFYKALLEVDSENALNTVLKFPGMQSVFMKLLPKMATKMFGKECGFDYRNFKANKKILQMDMTMCPYEKYAKRFNVEELTGVFCESDFATYGNLSKISFKRTETIGTGGSKCDFKFIRTDK